MANTSFDHAFQIRSKSLEELKDSDLSERASLEIIQEINKFRKSRSLPPLTVDENCMSAASDSFSNIGSLQSLTSSHSVIGSDFCQLQNEQQIHINPSMSQNTAIFEGFMQLYSSLPDKSKLTDHNFNHIGLSVKRSFASFKLMIILFKKPLIIYHAYLDTSTGLRILGRLVDPFASIFVLVVKDSKETTKPTLAGPRRILLKSENEFEVTVPRLLMVSRSISERFLEFYTVKMDTRSICYGDGQDLVSLPPDCVLSHKMSFSGLWESNVMFEGRSLTESKHIRDEYDVKVGSKVMVQNVGDFKSRGRGRGVASLTTGRADWGSRGTPWKPAVSGRLSTIVEVSKENDVKIDAWGQGNKENYSQSRDTNMGGNREHSQFSYNRNNDCGYSNNHTSPSGFSNPSGYLPQSSQAYSSHMPGGVSSPFATNSTVNPFATLNAPSGFSHYTQPLPYNPTPPMNNPYSQPIPPYHSSQPISSQNPFAAYSAPNPSYSAPSSQQPYYTNNPFAPQNFFSQCPPPSVTTPTNQQMYLNSYPPNPTFVQVSSPPIAQNTALIHSQYLSEMEKSLNYLRSANSSLHGASSFPLSLSANPGDKSSFCPLSNEETFGKQKASVFGASKKVEATQTCVEVKTEVALPCLILPIPAKLLKSIQRPRPENESYQKLHSTMEYHDVLLRIKDTDFKSHKAVLFSSSTFFRDQLDKSKNMTQFHTPKIILPSWFPIEAFKLVMKFMYTCDLDKEIINITTAKDMLAIADYLAMGDLCEILIVKFVLTQLTKEEALGVLKMALSREKESGDCWEYLIESCVVFVGQNSNFIVRNLRAECLALPIQCIIRIVDSAMRFIMNNEQISLVIKLLTDLRYAQCVFELTNKISALYLFGYKDYPVDIRKVDSMRPLTKEQLSRLDPKIPMEYPLFEEAAPFYTTTHRVNPTPPPQSNESINRADLMGKSIQILTKKELTARSKPVFSFTVTDIFRPKNIMSACFSSESRTWSILVSTSKDGWVSLFLCERGSAAGEKTYLDLLYTSVLFELEIDDEGVSESLRSSNQPGYSAGFYSFPNGQFYMVGERNFCKASVIKAPESVKIKVYLKEVGIHSGLMHYLCENFEVLMNKSADKFADLANFNLKYLLSHEMLPVNDEREAAAALWKYAGNKTSEQVEDLVNEIRFQYLSTKDLWTIARDHLAIRSTGSFKYKFKNEYKRRVENKPLTEKPRKRYAGKENTAPADYNEEIIEWLLTSSHHQGHEERITELKKRLEVEKAENSRTKAEIQAKKQEISQEWQRFSQPTYPIPPPAPPAAEVFFTPDKNCIIS